MSYIDITYSKERAPVTDYPSVLAKYLCRRFQIDDSSSLLELGSGRCELANYFSRLGVDVTATDLVPSAVEFLDSEELAKKFQVINFESDTFPFPDNSFDIVFAKSVLEHIYKPETFMKEAYRVLKPAGKLVLLLPDWRSQMQTFYEDPTHVKPYIKEGVRDLLMMYSYNKVKSDSFYHHPYLWKSRFFKALSFILRTILPTTAARALTKVTKIKFFRWAVESQIIASGVKGDA